MTEQILDEAMREYSVPQAEDIQFQLSQKTMAFSQELVEKFELANRLKKELKELHARINQLSYAILPDLMTQQGTNSIETKNGCKLELKPYFRASLPVDMDPEMRERALEYLRERAPDIIKTDVTVSYGVGEREQAEVLAKLLRGFGVEPQVTEGVHHMTLTSWLKHQFMNPPPTEEGREPEVLPLDLLHAEIGSRVDVTMDKSDKPEVLERVRKIGK